MKQFGNSPRCSLLFSLLALVPMLLVSSCGGSATEEAADDMLSAMEDFTEVLGDVTDKESAEANRDKLSAIATEMRELGEHMEGLGDAAKEEMKTMESTERWKAAQADLQKAIMGLVSKPDVLQVLSSVMSEIQS